MGGWWSPYDGTEFPNEESDREHIVALAEAHPPSPASTRTPPTDSRAPLIRAGAGEQGQGAAPPGAAPPPWRAGRQPGNRCGHHGFAREPQQGCRERALLASGGRTPTGRAPRGALLRLLRAGFRSGQGAGWWKRTPVAAERWPLFLDGAVRNGRAS